MKKCDLIWFLITFQKSSHNKSFLNSKYQSIQNTHDSEESGDFHKAESLQNCPWAIWVYRTSRIRNPRSYRPHYEWKCYRVWGLDARCSFSAVLLTRSRFVLGLIALQLRSVSFFPTVLLISLHRCSKAARCTACHLVVNVR